MSLAWMCRCGLALFVSLHALTLFAVEPIEYQEGMSEPFILENIRWLDDDDNTHHLSDTNGKPRLLHFWAAWCAPCREEMPDMLVWQGANPEFLVLPLSLDDRIAQTRHFLKKNNLAMPPLLLHEDDRERIDVPVVPYTLFLSAEGKVVGEMHGIASWADDDFTAAVHEAFKTE